MDTPTSHRDAAHKAQNSSVVEAGARTGFAISGVLHLMIAWIALRLAWGGGGGSADQSGALGTLSSSPGGTVILWVAVLGFALLAIWQLAEAVVGRHGAEAKDRASAAGKFVMYAALAFSASKFARGGGSSSGEQSADFTAKLMGATGGRFLVGLLGLAVIAGGIYHVYKGWTSGFLEDLESHPGRWAETSGRIGYVAKGVAFVIVGGLFGVAALQQQPEEARGLDGALKTLGEQPFGSVLLTLIALGLAAFGVYCFAHAKHVKL
ncbi:uncharacterized protein DUF1206 [Knoellia remsis]|uniref:Uncharacterized protein DUF1206 n=1 Tax=Knoellia remsis TaxID=407159 RepID=A0A2T0UCR4_9MICO|nr:DUF1206 domain-containing protein [Knoellia remsis]PRY55658.1 uncharacterized protein DUF1206 [Knoellia remsis]